MAERPVITLVDNPVAVAVPQPAVATPVPEQESPAPAAPKARPARQPRPAKRASAPEPAQAPPSGTNPYAGMHKVQAPVRLFPPLWDGLELLVRELRDEGLDVDKTALLNAMMHFNGPGDVNEARALVNRWRALLGSPPPPRR